MQPIVVVTGGAGFIGSHTVDALITSGHRVIVLDDFRTGKRENLVRWAAANYRFDGSEPSLEIVVADVSHGLFAPLAPWRRYGDVTAIIHLAAQVSVPLSLANPVTDMQVNYGATLHALEYARCYGKIPVVLASSAAVYGSAATPPISETEPAAPISPYGVHKYASELALRAYAATHGVPSTALRFFNVYGPRQDPNSPYSGVISIFAARAQANQPLTIFGDGTQTRDFIYVGDVVRGILAAMRRKDGQGEAINLGCGQEISIGKLAHEVVSLCGSSSKITYETARAGDIVRSYANVDRARRVLGFADNTKFIQGLTATLKVG